MDYYVTDAERDPTEDDQYYTEQVIRLPSGGCCWTGPADAPDVQPAPRMRNGHITLGSTHRTDKITDETIQLWARVMRGIENSRLYVYRNSLAHTASVREQLVARFQSAGIPAERIELAWDESGAYMHAYHEMDILLETIPWGSGTTALEACWMGVPIPTIYGDRPVCRATASALRRLDLQDLTTRNSDQYVDAVIQLAHAPDRLDTLRQDLRQRMQQTICHSDRFVRELEAAYRQVWEQWCHEH